jgi:UDP-N-acetylmuramate--alanine ligase
MKKDKKTAIYIIGIGGKGLNSIAEFCVLKGYQVAGSDCRQSNETGSLIQKGVSIFFNQNGEHICNQYDIVVYSAIIPYDHPERVRARELGIRQMSRAHFLKYITKKFIRISIAGSHGKSTTSALATLALHAQDGSVNSIIGAYMKEFSSYQKSGSSPYCVLEACEYKKSFLHLPGDYTLITSLEKSHMEYFKTEEHMNNAFGEFLSKHKSNAIRIINGDVPTLRQLCLEYPGHTITCGFNQSNDYVIKNVHLQQDGSLFDIYHQDMCVYQSVRIKIPGTYNILNTALVLTLLHSLGYINIDKFKHVLESFTGVGRRFELTQDSRVTLVDDFAHHPTQVKNLIQSIKQFYPNKKIVAVFEPRQAHLIKTFLREYGNAFKNVDEVCVTDVVPALGDTEDDISSINAHDIMQSIQTYSKPNAVWYARSYQEIVDKLLLTNLKNSIIATIGAGSIFRVRDLLLHKVL